LKKSGTKPEEILKLKAKRSYLDRVKVPRKIRIRCPCCKLKWSYIFCLFIIVTIDFCLLGKYLI
jgi:hypothetical protein